MNKMLLVLACLLLCCIQEVKAQPRNANAKQKEQAAVNSPSPVISQTPVNNPSEDASEAYRKERDAKDDVFREEQVRQGRIVSAATERIFYATTIYVFVTTVYAFFAFLTLRQIKKQARSADQSVVFGLRAHVGVHSVSPIDFKKKRFLIRFENIGKVPASQIEIKYVVEVRIPDRYAPDEQTKQPPWKQEEGNLDWVVQWGDTPYYGRAKLFPGNLKIKIPVTLWLVNPKQLPLIAQGHAKIFLKGNIGFSDGFNSGKNTPFAFRYSKDDNDWIVDAVITKEEIEALLAKRSKELFGDKGPQFIMHRASYPPHQPDGADEKGNKKENPK